MDVFKSTLKLTVFLERRLGRKKSEYHYNVYLYNYTTLQVTT